MESLFITVVFFYINNKRNRKKLYAEIQLHSCSLIKNLFLYINLKLVPFAPDPPVHSLSLISILVGILWSSKSFVKIHVAKYFENS